MKLLTDGRAIAVRHLEERWARIEERWYGPSVEFPNGSYELLIDGIPTDRQPNPYWHGQPPFFEWCIETIDRIEGQNIDALH